MSIPSMVLKAIDHIENDNFCIVLTRDNGYAAIDFVVYGGGYWVFCSGEMSRIELTIDSYYEESDILGVFSKSDREHYDKYLRQRAGLSN